MDAFFLKVPRGFEVMSLASPFYSFFFMASLFQFPFFFPTPVQAFSLLLRLLIVSLFLSIRSSMSSPPFPVLTNFAASPKRALSLFFIR